MGLASITSAVAGQVCTAVFYNNNLNAILNQLNGNIEAVNIANLAVTTAKINTGAVTGPKIAMGSDAQGDILFRGASNYERLAAGTNGYLLKTQGAGANPTWTIDNGGKWIDEQVGDVTAQSSFTISSLVAGRRYRLIVNLLQNTSAGEITIRFNSDSGANYSTGSTGPANGAGSTGQTAIKPFNYSGGSPTATAGYPIQLAFDISFDPSDTTIVRLVGIGGAHLGGAGNVYACAFWGSYDGASAVASISIITSAGTVTGDWALQAYSE